jgi:hypothetical protein
MVDNHWLRFKTADYSLQVPSKISKYHLAGNLGAKEPPVHLKRQHPSSPKKTTKTLIPLYRMKKRHKKSSPQILRTPNPQKLKKQTLHQRNHSKKRTLQKQRSKPKKVKCEISTKIYSASA